MKKWIKQNRLNLIIMSIYAISSLIILIFHESWRDEAQSWLIARDLDFIGIIRQMKYEGHFLLWYIILIPFAKLGLPYFSIKIISWIIVNISVWLILKKAPFKYVTKILIIFSPGILYLYPAIARSYCLIPLAIAIIAICYEKRNEKPIQYILSIILLANTHVIMLGLVGMLLLTFYLEQIKNRKQNKYIIISFCMASILLLITALPIFGSLSTNKELNVETTFNLKKIVEMLGQSLNVIIYMLTIYDKIYLYLILGIIIICAIYECRCYPKNFIIIFFSILFQLFIYQFIYGISSQRGFSAYMIILLFAWIQKKETKKNGKEDIIVEKMMIIVLIIFLGFGAIPIIQEIKYNYSSSEQTAKFINENLEENAILISNHMPCASALIPYLQQRKIWNPQKEDYFTYVTWDEDYITALGVDLKDKIEKNFEKDNTLYYIFEKSSNEIEYENIQELVNEEYLIKIFESEDTIKGEEEYIIFKIKTNV